MKKILYNIIFVLLLYTLTVVLKYGVLHIFLENNIWLGLIIYPLVEISAPFAVVYKISRSIKSDATKIWSIISKIILILILYLIWFNNTILLSWVAMPISHFLSKSFVPLLSNITLLIFPITSFIYWLEVVHVWRASILSRGLGYFVYTSYILGGILFVLTFQIMPSSYSDGTYDECMKKCVLPDGSNYKQCSLDTCDFPL